VLEFARGCEGWISCEFQQLRAAADLIARVNGAQGHRPWRGCRGRSPRIARSAIARPFAPFTNFCTQRRELLSDRVESPDLFRIFGRPNHKFAYLLSGSVQAKFNQEFSWFGEPHTPETKYKYGVHF